MNIGNRISDKQQEGIMGTYRILLVEKEPIDGAYIRNMLERIGYSVDLVQDEDMMISKLASEDYKAVLLSSAFLNGHGEDLTRRIRNTCNDAGHDVSIIGMANYSLSAERQRFQHAGIQQYLTKPIYQNNLSEMLGSEE